MNEIEKSWCSSILSQIGHSLQRQEMLKAEASHRKFYRVHTENSSFIFMVSPPSLENNEQFVNLSEIFNQNHIPVPRVLEFAPEEGHVLMTDVGSKHLEELYNTDAEPLAINNALDTLIKIQNITHQDLPDYTAQRLKEELSIFDEWILDKFLESPHLKGSETEASRLLVTQALEQKQVCIHRDYHCRNLLFSYESLGIVDFQDALIGPAFYDLASLLFDCYHDFRDDRIKRYLIYYLDNSTIHKQLQFNTALRWLTLTGIQRLIKAIGIFARLFLRDNKITHLRYIPRVLSKTIDLMSRYPEMKPLEELFVSIKQPVIRKIESLL